MDTVNNQSSSSNHNQYAADTRHYAPRSPDLPARQADSNPFSQRQQRQGYRGSISHTLTPFTPTDRRNPFSLNASPFSTQTNPFSNNQNSYFPPQQAAVPSSSHQSPHNPGLKQEFSFDTPIKSESGAQGFYTPFELGDPMAPNTRKRAKQDPDPDYRELTNESSPDVGPPSNTHASNVPEVRTKFPVARIKRIMQSDEDVGKVAQVTPVVVSKALELFMIDLVSAAATAAKSRSSKRVAAAHMKQAVMGNEKYTDWLGEIVSKVPDAPVKSGAGKDEDSDELGNDAPATGKKKRGVGGGKRKKREDE